MRNILKLSIKTIWLVMIIVSNLAQAQVEKKQINGTVFEFITVKNSGEDSQETEYIELFRNNKKLLSHIKSNFEGDCSSENIELGDYQVVGSDIIFYSYWASGDRMGKNIYPFGFRKQVYSVSDTGAVVLKKSEIYLETYIDSWADEHKGMKYLRHQPKSALEKQQLDDYTTKVAKKYASEFVFGKPRKNLEYEVRRQLGSRITDRTQFWESMFGSENYHR